MGNSHFALLTGESGMYDVVFEGCTVVDGSGGRGFVADVAVQDGKIAAIGALKHVEAQRKVSGLGKVLAPGFIDIHTHSDLPLLVNPRAESKVRQGVTTEVIGNCGLGPAPLTPDTREEIRETSTFLAKGSAELSWDWLRFGDYLDTMEKNNVALNVVPLVGHTPLRMAAMGMDRRPAQPAGDRTTAEASSRIAGRRSVRHVQRPHLPAQLVCRHRRAREPRQSRA